MDSQKFTRQFILTNKEYSPIKGWKHNLIGAYNLYTHPLLELAHCKQNNTELVLIGYIFDYERPKATNKDIINHLSGFSFDTYIRELDKYTGQFIVLRKENDSFTIISDAGAQREVYYTTDFSTFASQPILIEQFVKPIHHSNKQLLDFYKAKKFNEKRIYLGDTTQWKNIKHLSPNYYIDITKAEVTRFFPYKAKEENTLDYVANESIKRIKGFLQAVACRYPKVAMPVTAGYDSRLLFAASHDINCRYFIYKHRKLSEDHYDISISRKLLDKYPKIFEVITYDENINKEIEKKHSASIDFPRTKNTTLIFNGYKKLFADYVVLDTIMSELARNRYGNFKTLSAKDLAYLNGYQNNSLVISVYQEWLNKNKEVITSNAYNVPDLFYWEEIMGNWAAKSKTEYGLATEFFSLLNSRELITLMMSTKIKYRQPNNNILYNTLIEKMSPEAITLPMNPSRRTSIQKLMQKIGIFDVYRYVKIKMKL